jgi:hypothetical protein
MNPDHEATMNNTPSIQALANWKKQIPRNREERRKQMSKRKYHLELQVYADQEVSSIYGTFNESNPIVLDWTVFKVKKDGSKEVVDRSDRYKVKETQVSNNNIQAEAAPLEKKIIEPSVENLDGQATIKGSSLITKLEGSV